jgi:hypothetical protein
MKREI